MACLDSLTEYAFFCLPCVSLSLLVLIISSDSFELHCLLSDWRHLYEPTWFNYHHESEPLTDLCSPKLRERAVSLPITPSHWDTWLNARHRREKSQCRPFYHFRRDRVIEWVVWWTVQTWSYIDFKSQGFVCCKPAYNLFRVWAWFRSTISD